MEEEVGQREGGRGRREERPSPWWSTPQPLSLMLGHGDFHLQSEGFIPLRVEGALDGLGLLLALTFGIRDQFQFYVGI